MRRLSSGANTAARMLRGPTLEFSGYARFLRGVRWNDEFGVLPEPTFERTGNAAMEEERTGTRVSASWGWPARKRVARRRERICHGKRKWGWVARPDKRVVLDVLD